MIIEKQLQPNFNGVLFENDHACTVYISGNVLFFSISKDIKNLDQLIADNVAKNNEAAALL